MKIRPADEIDEKKLTRCLRRLRLAREEAKAAGCQKLAGKIRLALTSGGGAMRHLQHRMHRTRPDGTVRNWRDAR